MVKPIICFIGFLLILLALWVFPVSGQGSLMTLPTRIGDSIAATLLTHETFDHAVSRARSPGPISVEVGDENGVFRANTMNGSYVWGLNAVLRSDFVLEMEVTPSIIRFANGFGILRRASASCAGYS